MLLGVKDHPNLIKDSNSKAVLNVDESAVKRHEERLAKVNKELQRDKEMAELKNEVGELKGMLKLLLEKLNG